MGRKTEIETSEELINKWLKKIKKSVKASTYSTYIQIATKHILPYFKDKKINQKCVEKFIEEKKKAGYKANTINNIIVVLNSVLKGNKDLKAKKLKQPKKKTRILTEYERERLENYLLSNLTFFNFGILLMLYTGVRVGELSALQVTDIDAQNDTLSITKTLERIKNTDRKNGEAKTKIVISTPKSEASIRDIALIDFIIELYKKLYKGHNSGFLLTGKNRYVEPHQIDRIFKKILQDCNIESLNVHALRHTFATQFYRETRDIKTLTQILGHSSEVITIRLYVHTDLQEQKKGIEAMAQKRKTA